MISRRRFVAGAVASMLTAPRATQAQQAGKVWRLALVQPASGPTVVTEVFRRRLAELGYVEGQNITIDYRWMGGQEGRYRDVLTEVVSARPDLIAAVSPPAVHAAKAATTSIPVVMIAGGDPVGTGLVASLSRPGGNLTGTTLDVGPAAIAKLVEVLKELAPRTTRIGVMNDSTAAPNAFVLPEIAQAAQSLGATHHIVDVRSADDLDDAFATVTRQRVHGLLITLGPVTVVNRQRIVAAAAQARLPTVYPLRQFAEVGGLASHGPSILEQYDRAAEFVHKILRGAKPGDLPVEQPTRFELVINLNTARALGLPIPQALLLRADELIQ
jgi:putative tryptophan/tyrosine transport system substrate-binding protein